MNTLNAPQPVAGPLARRVRCHREGAAPPRARELAAMALDIVHAAQARGMRWPGLRRGVRMGAWIGLALAGPIVLLMGLVVHALQPAPGEWAVAWRLYTPLGTLERRLSVPVLLRWGTHPLAGALLDGRTVSTRTGRWHLQVGAGGRIDLACQPCLLQLDALGPQPVPLAQARWQFHRITPEHWQGTLRLGPEPAALQLAWQAQLRPDGLEIHAELPAVPVAQAVAVFADSVPQARQARITGQFALTLDAAWGASGLQLVRLAPRLDDVSVDGLGTEAWLDAVAPALCGAPRGGRVQGWLPKAVVAALDPHFHERSGADLRPWLAQPGASATLTQQLVRQLYPGQPPGAARGLREWLYAVEMERTLGKGRILQTYLAVAPWGPGLCGAEAASLHHFQKPSERLTPPEAAWLASLLVATSVAPP